VCVLIVHLEPVPLPWKKHLKLAEVSFRCPKCQAQGSFGVRIHWEFGSDHELNYDPGASSGESWYDASDVMCFSCDHTGGISEFLEQDVETIGLEMTLYAVE
jgi:hypothetical protein